MLKIIVPPGEGWDEDKEEFVNIGEEVTLMLEHSLVSISKWESRWHKCFLGDGTERNIVRSRAETLDYIECMTINKNVDREVYLRLTNENLTDIEAYMKNPMTATYIRKPPSRYNGAREAKTSEYIYWCMIQLNIPVEFEKWHINRLLTLIEVCNAKQDSPKKISTNAIYAQNRELNAIRRARLGTKG